MMDELTAKLHLSNLLEGEGNSGQMELACRAALDWLHELNEAKARIAELEDEVAGQATLPFVAG